MLPKDFETMMRRQLGDDEAARLIDALTNTSPVTSVRTNPTKKAPEFKGEPVAWCAEGMYLSERPQFTLDPLFHAGTYYVQEASSMILSHIISNYIGASPVVALDMCAAPGGKSTLLQSALPECSLLIANEVVRQRSQILAENIIKWGNPYSIVTSNYAEDFVSLGEVFDLIVCDAPCSGEGMFRKDEGAVNDWSLDNVDTCWRRQRDIIANVWQTLRTGGLFIYSTCTFNTLEDEDNVLWMQKELSAEVLPLCDNPEWNIRGGHFYPHLTRGEGFFVAVLRKTEDTDNHPRKQKDRGKASKVQIPKEIKAWIQATHLFDFTEEKDGYYAFPKAYSELLKNVKNTLHTIHYGIHLGEIKGKAIQPAHSLAMSTSLDISSFPTAELTYEEAIAYLRTEAITVDAPKGYILLTFGGVPLGFGKNIGNRVNNLYPTEWRIRKNL